ncbi:MAG: histidinol dehydrogenase [Candidatus Aminicenantia bacterium]
MVKIKKVSEVQNESFLTFNSRVKNKVRRIIEDVASKGDGALKKYTLSFDHVELKKIRVEKEDIEKAGDKIPLKLKEAIQFSIENLYRFSEEQMKILKAINGIRVEIRPGVIAEQRLIPIKRIGIYVPGGHYPLISSLYMAGVPARVAGVEEIVVCSPPKIDGTLPSSLLYTASLLKIDEIYSVGGAQAIAGMAVGTESIKKVEKIVGPGNIYVTEAKKELFGLVGIDFIAGPTELLIIADESAEPELIASELIGQSEHDIHARSWLLTYSFNLAEKVKKELNSQLKKIESSEIARFAIKSNCIIILTDNLEEAVEFSNQVAPEHLSLMVNEPEKLIPLLRNYGTLFVGEFSPVAVGDYSSGLNHILPTNGASRYTGGLNVKDFVKFQAILRVYKNGLNQVGESAIILAESEGLSGHAESIRQRLKRLR